MRNHFEGLSVGLGGEFEKTKETLPGFYVKNTALWVNPEINAPFDLRTGEETSLGVFLTTETEPTGIFKYFKKKEKVIPMESWPLHGRSSILGRVLFSDKQGNIYRDIDLKGGGYVKTADRNRPITITVSELEPHEDSTYLNKPQMKGLMGAGYAKRDNRLAEDFIRAGIRTDRILAILKLEEIVINGKKVAVEYAKEHGLIPEKLTPVIEVRAYGTKYRIGDYRGDNARENKRNAAIEDARLMVAQELGKDPEEFKLVQYMMWFAETLGKNIGLMHANGWYHHYLWNNHSPNNVTLDCRITDRDSAGELNDLKTDEDRQKELTRDKNYGLELILYLAFTMCTKRFYDECEHKGYSQENLKLLGNLHSEMNWVYNQAYREVTQKL